MLTTGGLRQANPQPFLNLHAAIHLPFIEIVYESSQKTGANPVIITDTLHTMVRIRLLWVA